MKEGGNWGRGGCGGGGGFNQSEDKCEFLSGETAARLSKDGRHALPNGHHRALGYWRESRMLASALGSKRLNREAGPCVCGPFSAWVAPPRSLSAAGRAEAPCEDAGRTALTGRMPLASRSFSVMAPIPSPVVCSRSTIALGLQHRLR